MKHNNSHNALLDVPVKGLMRTILERVWKGNLIFGPKIGQKSTLTAGQGFQRASEQEI